MNGLARGRLLVGARSGAGVPPLNLAMAEITSPVR